MEPSYRKRPAMTLVELIITICVILLLLAIIFPSIHTRPHGHPRAIVCRNNLKMWGLVMHMYCSDYDESFPQFFNTNGTSDGVSPVHWLSYFEDYCGGDEDMVVCPSAREVNEEFVYGGINNAYAMRDEIADYDGDKIDRCSYGINGWLSGTDRETKQYAGKKAANFWQKLDTSGMSNVPLIADAMWYVGTPGDDEGGLDGKSLRRPDENGQWLGEEYDMMHFAMVRHRNGINMTMADGSVHPVEVRELWNKKWHRHYDTEIVKTAGNDFWPEWMLKNK